MIIWRKTKRDIESKENKRDIVRKRERETKIRRD